MESGVELRDLRVFLAVAEDLHFGRAAERLCLSRSRVSQIVGTLEARLGARLFERTSRQVRLTAAGEKLRRDLEPHFQNLQLALERARRSPTTARDTLRIGIYTPFCMGRHTTEIVAAFRARHPDTEVVFVNAGSGPGYLDWLRSGAVDILAARLPLDPADLTVGPVVSCERRVLLVPRSDPLARQESLEAEDYADRVLADTDEVPRETTDAFSAVMRVAAGSQVYVSIPPVLELYPHPDVVSVPIADQEPLKTALVWSGDDPAPPITSFAAAAAAAGVASRVAGVPRSMPTHNQIASIRAA